MRKKQKQIQSSLFFLLGKRTRKKKSWKSFIGLCAENAKPDKSIQANYDEQSLIRNSFVFGWRFSIFDIFMENSTHPLYVEYSFTLKSSLKGSMNFQSNWHHILPQRFLSLLLFFSHLDLLFCGSYFVIERVSLDILIYSSWHQLPVGADIL